MYWVVLMHKSMYQVNKECNKCSVLLRLNFCLLHTTSIFIQLMSAYVIHRKNFIHTIVFAILQTRKHHVCCFGRMSHKVYLALDCQKWGWNLDILLVWLAASWSSLLEEQAQTFDTMKTGQRWLQNVLQDEKHVWDANFIIS